MTEATVWLRDTNECHRDITPIDSQSIPRELLLHWEAAITSVKTGRRLSSRTNRLYNALPRTVMPVTAEIAEPA